MGLLYRKHAPTETDTITRMEADMAGTSVKSSVTGWMWEDEDEGRYVFKHNGDVLVRISRIHGADYDGLCVQCIGEWFSGVGTVSECVTKAHHHLMHRHGFAR